MSRQSWTVPKRYSAPSIKDPVKRISSAEELIAAIRRHFANPQAAATASSAQMAAAAAVPATSADPTAKLKTKSKLPLILGAILLSQVVILGGYYLLTRNQATAVEKAEFEIVKAQYNSAKTLFTNKDYSIKAFQYLKAFC